MFPLSYHSQHVSTTNIIAVLYIKTRDAFSEHEMVQSTIVRVSSGSVTALGFASLVRAASGLQSVAGLDLANSGLADERCYTYLTRALKAGELAHLNILRLAHMELGDTQINALAKALSGHPELEVLCVAGNVFTSEAGIILFEQFTSLRRASALDLSMNYNLGDAMIDEMWCASGRHRASSVPHLVPSIPSILSTPH